MQRESTTPYGYCQCGCDELAPVANRNHTKYGHVKGEPMRFIRGHATRGLTFGDETRAKVSEAHRGRVTSPETKLKMSAAQAGSAGNNWRGGRIVREGRVLLYVGRAHAMADTYGYAYEHRLVAAQALGRILTTHEVVHHIDTDPMNNSASNLVVLTGGGHTRVHARIRAGAAMYDALTVVMEVALCG